MLGVMNYLRSVVHVVLLFAQAGASTLSNIASVRLELAHVTSRVDWLEWDRSTGRGGDPAWLGGSPLVFVLGFCACFYWFLYWVFGLRALRRSCATASLLMHLQVIAVS